MDINIKGFSFDRGIDRIIPSREQTLPGELPREGRLAPADARVTPRLERIVHTDTLDDVLRQDLAPQLDSADVLMPDAFHRAMKETIAALETARKAADPEPAATLDNVIAVLKEEGELRDLVDFYRNALFKG